MANSTTSAREAAGLRGQVKTCIEEAVWPAVLESPERRFSSTTEYDPYGRPLTIRYVAAASPAGNSSESLTAYEYDDDGRLVKFKMEQCRLVEHADVCLRSDRTDDERTSCQPVRFVDHRESLFVHV